MKSNQISLRESRDSKIGTRHLPQHILESKLHEDTLLICPASLPQDLTPLEISPNPIALNATPAINVQMYVSRRDLSPYSRLPHLMVYLTSRLAQLILHTPKTELWIFPPKLLYFQPLPSQLMSTSKLPIVQVRNLGILFAFYISPTSRYHSNISRL